MATASACVTRAQVLSLYKLMLKEASQFVSFNYRSFAVRRIKDGFRANKSLIAPEEIRAAYDKAVNSYELLQRQVAINKLYGTTKQIVEEA